MSSNRKDPEHQTPSPFKSVLKGFSPFTHVNNTPSLRTQTISTEERLAALRAYIPSDKDELNSAPPHMG
jgi:hypothetical protein